MYLDSVKNLLSVSTKSQVPTGYFSINQSDSEVSYEHHTNIQSTLSSKQIQSRSLLPRASPMTPNTSSPSFLSLHPELRTEIYRHLLPNAAEISPIPHSQRLLYPDSHLPSLRTDDAHCHPSILCLNRQIDTEASQLLYARTFTLKFFLNIVTFLGHDYARDPLHAGEAERREEFLLRFPFAKVRKLRVQISTFDGPATFSRELRQDLYINLAQVVAVVNRAAQPLNRTSIELAPCDFEFLEQYGAL